MEINERIDTKRVNMDYASKSIWGKVFKNGPNKICGRQLLKGLKWYDLPEQIISLQFF